MLARSQGSFSLSDKARAEPSHAERVRGWGCSLSWETQRAQPSVSVFSLGRWSLNTSAAPHEIHFQQTMMLGSFSSLSSNSL